MKQYLLDTSVLLDLLLDRPPWAADVAILWDAHREGRIGAHVAAFTLPTIYYVIRKQAGIPAARTAVHACLTTLDIATVDRATLLAAEPLSGPDFEDDLQIACAMRAGVDAIVTRDPRGFAASPVPVLSPADAVAVLAPPTSP
jgi:predicted nucleic acid-binding protein